MSRGGVIDEVGPGVADPELSIGRPVVGIVDNSGSRGGYSQYVVLAAESVTATPSGATFPEAASFLMNALTARNDLDLLALPEGATVLVTGAAGGVGGYVVVLAHAGGLRVVAVASPADEADARAWGANVFVPRGDGVVEAVLEAVPGGVDAVIDAALLREAILPAVRDGGAAVTLRSGSWRPSGGSGSSTATSAPTPTTTPRSPP